MPSIGEKTGLLREEESLLHCTRKDIGRFVWR
jgi:hypothetical protein